MRVLVTGASGFVGRHLTRALAEHGDEIIAWGFTDTPHADGAVLDLLDPDAPGTQDLRNLDAVIHLAGLAQAGPSFTEPARYVSTNTAMEINLFEGLLRQQSFPRVLVVSTGAVYGGSEALITETSPLDPTSPYMVSKLAQEMLGWYYSKRGFEVIVARPFNHIGPGQGPGYLVADVCSQIVALEASGGGELVVGNLQSVRDYTDVRDVAAAYIRLVHVGTPGEVYNVCSGTSHSGEELVKALCRLAYVPVKPTRDSALTRPTDPSDLHASNAKLREHTGWVPTIPLELTLKATLDYWRTRAAVGQIS